MRRFRRFPLLAAPSALVNSAGLEMPLLLVSAIYLLGPRGGRVRGFWEQMRAERRWALLRRPSAMHPE